MNGPPTLSTRKMRKNFAGVTLLILAGILICLALSNLVLMEDEQDQKSEKNGQRISTRITFRSLKGNRKVVTPSESYSIDTPYYHR